MARVFEKEHKDVLKSIRELGSDEEFNRRNFAPVEYRDAKGEMRPEYLITRDGFTLLVDVLEIDDARKSVGYLDDDEKGVANTDTLGGQQQMLAITESVRYFLTLSSGRNRTQRHSISEEPRSGWS